MRLSNRELEINKEDNPNWFCWKFSLLRTIVCLLKEFFQRRRNRDEKI